VRLLYINITHHKQKHKRDLQSRLRRPLLNFFAGPRCDRPLDKHSLALSASTENTRHPIYN